MTDWAIGYLDRFDGIMRPKIRINRKETKRMVQNLKIKGQDKYDMQPNGDVMCPKNFMGSNQCLWTEWDIKSNSMCTNKPRQSHFIPNQASQAHLGLVHISTQVRRPVSPMQPIQKNWKLSNEFLAYKDYSSEGIDKARG